MTPLARGDLTGQGSGFCRWLHPIHRQLGEESEEFALRVQQVAVNVGVVEVGSLPPGEKEKKTRRGYSYNLPILPSWWPKNWAR